MRWTAQPHVILKADRECLVGIMMMMIIIIIIIIIIIHTYISEKAADIFPVHSFKL